MIGHYLMRVLVAGDVFLNVCSGGEPDMTISARTGKAALKGKRWAIALKAVLDWIEPGHCEGAIIHDEQRAEQAERDLGK